MSIFALNVTPYITSSIIIQLLTIAIPALEEMQKDGEDGRKEKYSNYPYLNDWSCNSGKCRSLRSISEEKDSWTATISGQCFQ